MRHAFEESFSERFGWLILPICVAFGFGLLFVKPYGSLGGLIVMILGWVVWFLLIRRERVNQESAQTCFVYCHCGAELCNSESFVSDDDRGVFYRCTVCGEETWWNFDCPAPFKMPGPMEIRPS